MTDLPSSFAPRFRAELDALLAVQDPDPSRWVYAPYDQLTAAIGLLAEGAPEDVGVVLVESAWKAAQRPYHQQKLALILANTRHFALEQAQLGRPVRYVFTRQSFGAALESVADELGPLHVMEPAERELREDLRTGFEAGWLVQVPHAGWLTTREQFLESTGDAPPWRMDRFYRRVRQDSGILMEADGQPLGGQFSYDAENRKPWKGEPPAPDPPRFRPDAVTQEVLDFVSEAFADHPGTLDGASLPATLEDARSLWSWAQDQCLPHFGPYEDAFSATHRSLFHTRLAPLLNLHRLLPNDVIETALSFDLPLPSLEGFVRQILGWREFVRHVHRETDGFRTLTDVPTEAQRPAPPYGSWNAPSGARPSALATSMALPPAYWDKPSGLACLDHTVAQVWEEAYTHHIPRLMILANLATLLGARPRELTDWFWVAFLDAYDWVVEPNVLAMGTFATGPLMTTKPYVSGAAYLDRMGDHCKTCAWDPKRNCPITALYWNFLNENREVLAGQARMAMPLRSLEKRSPARRAWDRDTTQAVRERLAAGETLRPEDFSDLPSA